LGNDAYYFVDFLASCDIRVWQTLPLNPTLSDRSPYLSYSAHAGNPELIDVDKMIEYKLAPETHAELADDIYEEKKRRDFFESCFAFFQQKGTHELQHRFHVFKEVNEDWLANYALFVNLKQHHDFAHWLQWPDKYKFREEHALADFRATYSAAIDALVYEQFVFDFQWHALRDYANENGVELFGDMPIFVSQDSADCWQNPELFLFDEDLKPTKVAGVPPDYFSETGQRWGNPLYDWEAMASDDFQWWINRLRNQLRKFDFLRIDHFRGFEACWEIPAEEEYAINGQWQKVPGEQLFNALRKEFGAALPLVAEDLGFITEEVHQLRQQFGLPGMKVLQFAFDGSYDNHYLPHNHERGDVVYTGTHDNDTLMGWYHALDESSQADIYTYFGNPKEKMPWMLMRQAMASVADLCMLTMQDVLALGTEARMNMPGTTEGNWSWRLDWSQVEDEMVACLKDLVQRYDRDHKFIASA
jgi:4-alpha-glucanotransferase